MSKTAALSAGVFEISAKTLKGASKHLQHSAGKGMFMLWCVPVLPMQLDGADLLNVVNYAIRSMSSLLRCIRTVFNWCFYPYAQLLRDIEPVVLHLILFWNVSHLGSSRKSATTNTLTLHNLVLSTIKETFWSSKVTCERRTWESGSSFQWECSQSNQPRSGLNRFYRCL